MRKVSIDVEEEGDNKWGAELVIEKENGREEYEYEDRELYQLMEQIQQKVEYSMFAPSLDIDPLEELE